MHDRFSSLPPNARVWLFGADAPIPAATLEAVRDWLPSWASHGRPVTAEADVLAEHVLAIAALISPDDLNAGVSGCGIDAMAHTVEAALSEAGIGQLPALSVTFRGPDGSWETLPRPAFRRLAKAGEVDGATTVLDLTPTDLRALRSTGVERPAAEAWHGRAFGLAVSV